jgi:5-methylthioadenosine/S-adenosylhomocysteine deaminase
MGSVQYANDLGVLGPNMLAAHCAGILPEELGLLADANVRIAHCPDTVIRAGEQVPPIWELCRRGAVLGIGTDGAATNNGQNPWEAMKLALYLQRVRFSDPLLATAADVLDLATVGGAAALGLANRVGSLEAGKEADIVLLQRAQLHLLPDAALVNNLVLSGLNNVADTVLVHGEVLLRHGISTVVDEKEVVDRAREAQKGLLEDTGLDIPLGPTPAFTMKRTSQG